MIVVDASALLEFLLQTPLGHRVEARLFRDLDEFHAPHFVDCPRTAVVAYFVDPNPSAHENSRNSSFGADTFL